MRVIRTSINTQEPVSIVPFFDLHIGSPKCKLQSIKDAIQTVRTNPNCFAVIGGDIIDNSTKDSIGDTYTETMSPMDQIRYAAALFEPIKSKILCVTSGNHERRSYKKAGVDLVLVGFADALGITHLYDPAGCLIDLSLGLCQRGRGRNRNPVNYTMYITHGDGNSGRTVGGKANGLSKRSDVVDADVYITGHTHMPVAFKESKCFYDRTHKKLRNKDVLFVNAASFLNYEQYAELMGLPPSSTSTPLITLSAASFEATCVL